MMMAGPILACARIAHLTSHRRTLATKGLASFCEDARDVYIHDVCARGCAYFSLKLPRIFANPRKSFVFNDLGLRGRQSHPRICEDGVSGVFGRVRRETNAVKHLGTVRRPRSARAEMRPEIRQSFSVLVSVDRLTEDRRSGQRPPNDRKRL